MVDLLAASPSRSNVETNGDGEGDEGDFFASSPTTHSPAVGGPGPSSSVKRGLKTIQEDGVDESPSIRRTASTTITSSAIGDGSNDPRARASLSPIKRGGGLFRGGESDDDDEPLLVADPEEFSRVQNGARKRAKRESPPRLSKKEEEVEDRRNGRSEGSAKGKERSVEPETPEIKHDWKRRYVGHFCVAGWALSKGRGYCSEGSHIVIIRNKPNQTASSANAKKPPPTQKKQTKLMFGSATKSAPVQSAKAAKQKEDYVVRFSNDRGFEVGRLPTEVAIWVSKLMDLDIAEFEGHVIDCPLSLTVGCDVLLDIKAYLRREAFPASIDVRRSRNTRNEPAQNFFEETAETSSERELRQRKGSLIRLFKACDLKPSQANEILQQHTEEGSFNTSSMLDHFGGKETLNGSTTEPASPQTPQKSGNGVTNSIGTNPQAAINVDGDKADSARGDEQGQEEAEGDDVNDGTEMESDQLAAVYSKAQRHDSELAEVDPPDTFALQLRPYQKQALGWMTNMERPASQREGKEGQRQDASLHPLWQEYRFPAEENIDPASETDTGHFYFNPYIGEMSLEFQPASHGARGGILADEMGLGKTIMVASLIHANRAPAGDDEADEEEQLDDERSKQIDKKTPRQTSLAAAFASSGSKERRMAAGGRATLVVAPMSLIGQWRNELERASVPGTLSVMMYYGEAKGGLIERLEGGSVDVIITSYGTLVSEYKRFNDIGGPAAPGNKTAKAAPLFAVDWLRVILDEAHSIRNRTTRNARACHDLMARRRWCLTGSPIVNRLTDLYSLLNFLRVEPWGDFAFFNSFIGKPFANKNPKALEIVQVVLETILLRREKKMKDKDGKPIVSLPSKTVEVRRLDFSPIEKRIYDLCFDRAWIQYQRLRADGSVNRNLSLIFSVLMRLRQAVCHPLLVLQAIQTTQTKAKEAGVGEVDEEAEKEVKDLIAKYQAGQEEISAAADDEAGVGTKDVQALEASMSTLQGDAASALLEQEQEECPVCHDPQSEPARLPCGHTGCRGCLVEHLQACEDRGETPNCIVCKQGPLTIEDIQDVVDDATERGASSTPLPRKVPSLSSMHPLSADASSFHSSTKLTALIADLAALREKEPGFKAVIFSQFTSFLDLVEVVLRREGYPFLRLDGTTSQKERESVLAQFASTQASKGAGSAKKNLLMLISLRAGGTGLNLTSANHCLLLDYWWNSSTEEQAIDRVHRIGQERDVTVHRYLIQDSIEERILLIQARKKALVQEAFAGRRARGAGGMAGEGEDEEEESETAQNLKILFGE